MTRKNFPRSVKVAVVKRATKNGVTYCEKCGCPARRFEVDHIIADALGGSNTIENAELLCKGDPTKCHDIKTDKSDKPAIAKAYRREAKALGIAKDVAPIKSAPFKISPRTARNLESGPKSCAGITSVARQYREAKS